MMLQPQQIMHPWLWASARQVDNSLNSLPSVDSDPEINAILRCLHANELDILSDDIDSDHSNFAGKLEELLDVPNVITPSIDHLTTDFTAKIKGKAKAKTKAKAKARPKGKARYKIRPYD